MRSAYEHTIALNELACAAAVAFDGGDPAAGYAALVRAEAQLRQAKTAAQLEHPQAVLAAVAVEVRERACFTASVGATTKQIARLAACRAIPPATDHPPG